MRIGARHILLFNFSLVYRIATGIRNWLYDTGIRKQYHPPIPTIVVGNIEAGGTGKTPHTEYITSLLLRDHAVAFLSRGYKRNTSGFVLADNSATPGSIGDEPFQVKEKFPELIVAVDADRPNGIRRILESGKPDVIILDDAFQHRRLKAGLSIVIVSYHRPFWDDFIIPTGRLRESSSALKRADAVVVSKIPESFKEEEIVSLKGKFSKYPHLRIFFSSLTYCDPVPVGGNREQVFPDLTGQTIILVTGIVNPKPLYIHLSSFTRDIIHLEFNDHHSYTQEDIKQIMNVFHSSKSDKKVIVTTEKDAVKLKEFVNFGLLPVEQTCYVPVKVNFLGRSGDEFDKMISDYVGKNR